MIVGYFLRVRFVWSFGLPRPPGGMQEVDPLKGFLHRTRVPFSRKGPQRRGSTFCIPGALGRVKTL